MSAHGHEPAGAPVYDETVKAQGFDPAAPEQEPEPPPAEPLRPSRKPLAPRHG